MSDHAGTGGGSGKSDAGRNDNLLLIDVGVMSPMMTTSSNNKTDSNNTQQ